MNSRQEIACKRLSFKEVRPCWRQRRETATGERVQLAFSTISSLLARISIVIPASWASNSV